MRRYTVTLGAAICPKEPIIGNEITLIYSRKVGIDFKVLNTIEMERNTYTIYSLLLEKNNTYKLMV